MKKEKYPNLTELVESDELWKHVCDFDSLSDRSKPQLLDQKSDSEAAKVALTLHDLAFEHYFLTLVFRFKAREIARGVFDAEKQRNHLVLFNLARAFMEHTGSLTYQEKELEKAIEDISSRDGYDQISQSILNRRTVVKRLYYGGKNSPKGLEPINSTDLIRSLNAVDERTKNDYVSLCEFVHPNYDSSRLVSSGELSSGIIGEPSASMSHDLTFAREAIERCAELDWKIVSEISRHLMTFEKWISNASADRAKLSQIFSVRSAYSGDGKTKDTALFFKNARTHMEQIEALKAYLQKQGIKEHSAQVVEFENDHAFYKLSTNRGLLWVKFKNEYKSKDE